MKKRLFFAVLFAHFLLCVSSVNAQTGTVTFEKADVNGDKCVDISDVVAVINYIAHVGNVSFEKANVNGDNRADISDIVSIINYIAQADAAVKVGLCPDSKHPHIIDMGTAGKWSCCNVDASAPWECGGYYAWGEIREKNYYDWSTYRWSEGSAESCYDFDDIAGTDYDVAHEKWGGSWCMPTFDQIERLINDCSSEWIEVNGMKGRKFSASNGGSIFFPATGFRGNDFTIYVGEYCNYWSSTQSLKKNSDAYGLFADSGKTDWYYFARFNGRSVRPVNIDPAVAADLCPDSNHPHVIDMGPAGKWACCNVGASAPWDSGGYYAWGETEEKDNYNWDTYTHCDGSYETCHNIGSDIAGTQYDVANKKWDSSWCIPNYNQIQLLLDNCSAEWMELNNIGGEKFTASNGGSIFLPASGYIFGNSKYGLGRSASYWLSTQHPSNLVNAYILYYDNKNVSLGDGLFNTGRPVRPIKK